MTINRECHEKTEIPKVLLSTGSLFPYGLNRVFKIAKEANFDGLELILRPYSEVGFADTWDLKYLKSLEKENDLKICSFHVPFEIEENENPDKILDETKDLAKKLGVKTLILHVPRLYQEIYLKWFKKGKWNDDEFNICVENLYVSEKKIDPLYVLPIEFNSLQNVCLDFAHALRGGINPGDFLTKLSNIRHIHCSSWDGKSDHLSIQGNSSLFEKMFNNLDQKVEIVTVELCPKAFEDIFNESEIVTFLQNECSFIKSMLKANEQYQS